MFSLLDLSSSPISCQKQRAKEVHLELQPNPVNLYSLYSELYAFTSLLLLDRIYGEDLSLLETRVGAVSAIQDIYFFFN